MSHNNYGDSGWHINKAKFFCWYICLALVIFSHNLIFLDAHYSLFPRPCIFYTHRYSILKRPSPDEAWLFFFKWGVLRGGASRVNRYHTHAETELSTRDWRSSAVQVQFSPDDTVGGLSIMSSETAEKTPEVAADPAAPTGGRREWKVSARHL